MGTCTYRTLGRRPGCEADMEAAVESMRDVLGGFAGNVFFVDPNHPQASDQHTGLSADAPVRTPARAWAQAQPYNGDAILVMHNSFWTYGDTSVGRATPITGAIVANVPGVRMIGVNPGNPLGVPWVPSANNQTLITVTAMDIVIEGFNFWDFTYTGATAISAGWDSVTGVYGENLTVQNCAIMDLDYGIKLDYTWYCRILNCRFDSLATAAIHNPSVFGEPDYTTVKDCFFLDNLADVSLADCDYCWIEGNRFVDTASAIKITGGNRNTILNNSIDADPTGTNNMINLTGGGNNLVGGNYLSCTIAQYDTTCSDAGSGAWGGNHCANGDTTAAPT